MPSLRDGCANRLYAAEWDAFRHVPWTELSQSESLAFARKVLRSAAVRKLWAEYNPGRGMMPPVTVKITHGSGSRYFSWLGEIRLGRDMLTRHIVLHEIAHAIARSDSGHGREFARVYLALVRRFLPADAPALLASYRSHRVRYTKLPTRRLDAPS